MDIRSFLAHTFLFNSFTDQEMDLLTSAASLKKVRKGEQIFSEGLEATAFFIVVSGKVKVFKLSPDGKAYTHHIHGPGEPVAEAAIFDSATYPASCMALEDTTLVRISRAGFMDLIKKYPELSLKIMSGYSKRLRQFVAKIEELTGRDVKSRLARYLMENAIVENGKTVCRLTHSKKELSSLLGTIPETLSRTLGWWVCPFSDLRSPSHRKIVVNERVGVDEFETAGEGQNRSSLFPDRLSAPIQRIGLSLFPPAKRL